MPRTSRVVLARLQTAPVVRTEIADAVNQGWRVTIPRSDLTRNIWTGIGYVMVDPATGAGGYFISGGLAGGITILPPEDWPDQPVAEELGSPNAEPPNTDPTSVRYLTKVAITDKQKGTVNQPLERALKVWARDAEGRPVKDAAVTFVAQFGGGRFTDADTFDDDHQPSRHRHGAVQPGALHFATALLRSRPIRAMPR